MGSNVAYPLDGPPITAQNALLFSGSRELTPPFNDQPTTGLPSIGLERGPENSDADDALVRSWFKCYLDEWNEDQDLPGQSTDQDGAVDCSFGTIGFRGMHPDHLPLE